jgi:hypothetical protein
MRKSRVVIVLAAGFVMAGLGMGILAYLTTSGAEARASMLPEPATWMPASAGFIFYLDLASLQSSPLRDEWESGRFRRETVDEIEKFREATGMDPWTDFYSLAFSADSADEDHSRLWGLALNGEFDQERLLSTIGEHKSLEYSTYKSVTLHIFSDDTRTEGKPVAIAFPESITVLFGSPQYVKTMLDVGARQAPSSLEGPLAGWIEELPLDETFWCVGSGDDRLSRLFAQRHSETPQIPIPPLQSFAISGNLSADVTVTARGEASDPEAARKMADVVRGLVALGSLQGEGRPELQAVLDSISIGTLDDRVEVSLAVPYETLRRLALAGEEAAN